MSTPVASAMLYPGHSAEDEFPALEGILEGVRLPVRHTWEGPTDHTVAALRELGSAEQLAPAARAAAEAGAGSVVWACTSGSFVHGPDGMREQAGWMAEASGLPSTSTSLAFLAALEHLGIGEVSVAATYPAEVAAHLTAVLAAAGVRVTAIATHDVPSGEDAGRLSPDQVRALIGTEHDAPAVLVPDTALHTVGLISELEQTVGRTVLTANLVSAWHGLRLAGWRGHSDRLGRLFRS
ncbi:maleate cis-trans isomerase family protein [Enemella evansiae]|uniref:maleate cis-trans isomerase family protein n=1 Tax=Enemella evansiae TaxID=2016499 RepID=UPI00106189D7|nr:maleate cis-trans isomerase [Enemella evansiae]TDO87971.1 maleate cis-trans isomerase [Enemella evansiae]